jgi:hypothetical protein
MTAEIEGFVRDAAQKRGIDPDIAVRAFRTEGGVDEYAKLGDFSGPPWYSGKSWWPPQLHYGGSGYESFGKTAGMGNSFTGLTGWQPGDPRAWRDAIRYALNRVKLGGWGPWYGPASIGITGFTGVNRDASWDANGEVWDYEAGVTPMPKLTYNPDAPVDIQDNDWSCSEQSAQWLLRSIGRTPGDAWIRGELLTNGIVTQQYGLMDASGNALAAWLQREYGDEMGLTVTSKGNASWDDIAALAGTQPVMIGGRAWNHWVGVRRVRDGGLELANPAPNWQSVGNLLDRAEFDRWGSWSYVTVSNGTPTEPETKDDPRALIAEIRERLDRLERVI